MVLCRYFFIFWFSSHLLICWGFDRIRAYFSPISTIICRKEREKFNLKFLGLWILTNSTMGGLLPHFWKDSLSTANFWPVFPLKVSRRKKHNTFDRFFVEDKWKYKKIENKKVQKCTPPLCYPPLNGRF